MLKRGYGVYDSRVINKALCLVAIECTKEGVKFACNGDIGSGSVTLRSHTNVEKPENNIDIALSEPVALTFSLKYLGNFCKASGLSSQVKLCLSNEVPLLVEYGLANGSHLRFYLAPKASSALRTKRCIKLTEIHRLEMKSEQSIPTSSSIRNGQLERGVRKF